jgi:hypothetical protein
VTAILICIPVYLLSDSMPFAWLTFGLLLFFWQQGEGKGGA